MEFEHSYSTSGKFQGQDLTFVSFPPEEAEYKKYFTDIMHALCALDPSLQLSEYDYKSMYVNRFLSAEELAELTNGCPIVDSSANKKPSTSVNPRYL